MDFDFKKEFKAYSNERLYDIVSHPDRYSNVAVAAAKEMLEKDRANWQPAPEMVPADSHPVSSTDIFADMDLSQPQEDVYMKRLKMAVLVVLAFSVIILAVSLFVELNATSGDSLDPVTGKDGWLRTAYKMFFVLIASFLWLRGNRWGYIMVFIEFLVSSAIFLKLIWNNLSNNQGEGMIELALYLLAFGVFGILTALLYHQKAYTYFNIKQSERNLTVTVALGWALRAISRM